MKLLRPCVQFIDMLVVIDCIVNMKQVDLVLFGHVHNYERTCSVFQNECKAMPTKDKNGMDTYDGRNYSAPVHAVIGMAGFTLDKFSNNVIIPSQPSTLSIFSLHASIIFSYIHPNLQDSAYDFLLSNLLCFLALTGGELEPEKDFRVWLFKSTCYEEWFKLGG